MVAGMEVETLYDSLETLRSLTSVIMGKCCTR